MADEILTPFNVIMTLISPGDRTRPAEAQWRRQGGASRGTGPGCKTLCPGCAPAVELQ